MLNEPKHIRKDFLESLPEKGPVVMVQYPSRAAFLEMMTSSEYAQVNAHRENGVEAHVVMSANQTYSKFAPTGSSA